MDKFTVTEKDLNAIDWINGSANVDYKGMYPPNLKGALAKAPTPNRDYKVKSFANQEWVNSQIIYLSQMWDMLTGSIAENFIYKNLPIDKYVFERFLQKNGTLACIDLGDELAFFPYTVEESDHYGTPIKIKIKISNGKTPTFDEGEFAIISNCEGNWTTNILSERLILSMENVLYEMQKNMLRSRPKGIVDIGNNKLMGPSNSQDKAEMYESIINSDVTFHVVVRDDDRSLPMGDGQPPIFTPIVFPDNFESLKSQYNIYKEELKELFGFGIDPLVEKKERKNTLEVGNQQKLSNARLYHLFNYRKNGLDQINKIFGTNFTIEKNPDLWFSGGGDMEMNGSED